MNESFEISLAKQLGAVEQATIAAHKRMDRFEDDMKDTMKDLQEEIKELNKTLALSRELSELPARVKVLEDESTLKKGGWKMAALIGAGIVGLVGAIAQLISNLVK